MYSGRMWLVVLSVVASAAAFDVVSVNPKVWIRLDIWIYNISLKTYNYIQFYEYETWASNSNLQVIEVKLGEEFEVLCTVDNWYEVGRVVSV